MQLVIAIGEKILEAIDIDSQTVKDAQQLSILQDELADKHFLTLAAYQAEPQFYIQVKSGEPRSLR